MRSIIRTSGLLAALVATPVLLVVGCQEAAQHAQPAARKAPVTVTASPAVRLVGDDNRDGRIAEEESGWKCRTMGNSRCGKRPVALVCIAKKVKDPMTGRPVNATRVPPHLIPACVTLAAKPGHWTTYQGAAVYVAPGAARVVECRTQAPGLEELTACLRQK